MSEISTNYGVIKGISYLSQYPDGSIKDCIPTEPNELKTSYGKLIPQYQDDGLRRKQIKPLSFYKNGNLKSISLQNQVEINTSIGVLPAEYVAFYEDGSIKRLFPLDGKLSGYWDEEDEYGLARDVEFNFSFGKFKQKVIGIHFYENGAVKSITFWPKDMVTIQSPVGTAVARIGIALYPDGKLKSYEPAKPTGVDTPIGIITAYDGSALGIHGDSNSLRFSEDGKVENVVTSTNKVEVTGKDGRKHVYTPGSKPSMFNPDANELVPLRIQFYGNKVCFNNTVEYVVEECTFSIGTFLLQTKGSCSACSGCTACG